MAKFAQYAIAASQEALDDAGWNPKVPEDLTMSGVYVGSGIGSFDDVYDTSIAFDHKVCAEFCPE